MLSDDNFVAFEVFRKYTPFSFKFVAPAFEAIIWLVDFE
jgi:hypothetical protein